MVPTIRIDDKVMEKLKDLAVEHGVIFGSPNEVLRKVFRLDEMSNTEIGDAMLHEQQSFTGYPVSTNPQLQTLLNQLRPELSTLTQRFEQDSVGRHVSRPENFVTIKVQERVQDLAFTVYGRLEDFMDIRVSFEMKPYRSSYYSSFKINHVDQISDAVKIIRRARQLRQNRGRR